MICCAELDRMLDRDLVRNTPMHTLTDGRIVTEIDTEFFLRFGEERPTYAGLNYCPFCGRALSRGLWNMEKKK
jgi:nitrite reductase/ring-hydroxylating ferredoxin subunit